MWIQCVKWKPLSRVQLFATPWAVVHGILQARKPEWVASRFSRDLPNPGIEPRSPTLQVDSSPVEPQIMEWVAYPSPADLPDPGIELGSPALQVDFLPTELSGKPFSLQGYLFYYNSSTNVWGRQKCMFGISNANWNSQRLSWMWIMEQIFINSSWLPLLSWLQSKKFTHSEILFY